FSDASPITLSASGPTSLSGQIAVVGQVDYFQFVAPSTGLLSVREDAGLGSSLIGSVSASDSLFRITSGSSIGRRSNEVSLAVQPGQSYYVWVDSGQTGTTGSYRLTFTMVQDDYGNDVAHASVIALSADTGVQRGNIEVPGNQDMFQFTASASSAL